MVVLLERAQSVYTRTERSADLLESSTDRLQSVYELGERARTERTERHSDFFFNMFKKKSYWLQVLKLNVVTTFLKRVGLTLNEKDVLRTWYLTFIMLRIGTFSDRLDVLRTV